MPRNPLLYYRDDSEACKRLLQLLQAFPQADNAIEKVCFRHGCKGRLPANIKGVPAIVPDGTDAEAALIGNDAFEYVYKLCGDPIKRMISGIMQTGLYTGLLTIAVTATYHN